MATTFKPLSAARDIKSTATNLHEAIPLTGTIVSASAYNQGAGNLNIKNYSHGMFQSVYDYPYLSSSANHIFDVTFGFGSGSLLSSSSGITVFQSKQKAQMYNEMAQVLAGVDPTGAIRQFDEDGQLSSGNKIENAIFLPFSRLLTKDELQKGQFTMDISVDPTGNNPAGLGGVAAYAVGQSEVRVRVKDISGSTSFKTNSPAGEYNILYLTSSVTGEAPKAWMQDTGVGVPCGLIYYQAGVIVLTSSLFMPAKSGGLLSNAVVDGSHTWGKIAFLSGTSPYTAAKVLSLEDMMLSSSISGTADGLRARIQNISFTNTTELNSTIYFCRAESDEFNYSSNPTYLSSSQIRVKSTRDDSPISYITTVGLYGSDNELLAVAKLSEPLKKTPENEFTLRVRLDY
jgi:hypothetical protein